LVCFNQLKSILMDKLAVLQLDKDIVHHNRSAFKQRER
jgi:hypothetical protein